jgi:hypothetical protein
MKLIFKILNTLKSFYFFLNNVSSINNSLVKSKHNENKIDFLLKKLNELEMNFMLDEHKITYPFQGVGLNNDSQIPTKKNEIFDNHFLQIESIISIYNALPNIKFISSTRGWAGSPDFLNKIIETIFINRPHFVLEAGCGVSSILVGLALKLNNYGKALSLENNPFFSEKTRKNIELNDVNIFSIISDCPLCDYQIDGETWKWYETKELAITHKIDLLIIDGPPGNTQKLARYPAIPLLHQYFADNLVILLDDANRPDEIIIIDKWIEFLTNLGYRVTVEEYPKYDKGLVILNLKKIM